MKVIKLCLVGMGLLLTGVVLGPLVWPIPPLTDTVPSAQLAAADSQFVSIAGLTVHYKQYGQGTPVFILLHGFAASEFSWRNVVTPLAQLGTVIAYDRPAFGLTDRPMPGEWTGRSPYGAPAQADMLIGLMDTLNVKQAILIGHSAGGTLAALTALRYPERVPALVLVDPAIYTNRESPEWLRWLFATPQGRRLGPLFARQIQTWGKAAWHDPAKLSPEIWAGYTKPLRAHNWDRALWELTLANEPLNLAEQLDQITQPVLVITGDDDRIVPTAHSIRLAGELPHAQLVVLPHCGHVPHEECPTAFLPAALNFITNLHKEQ